MKNTANIPSRRRTSALSEFSVLSAGILALVILLAVFAVAAYIFMIRPPAKNFAIQDNASLLSKNEVSNIAQAAKNLSEKKQINVIVVTTDDKGPAYAQDDEGSALYARDKYIELAHGKSFKDNSGVLLLIDMENRYVYVYTYATAHAAVTNDECTAMAESVVPALQGEQYASALESLISQISSNDFISGPLIFVYILYIAGPLAIVILVLALVSHNMRTKITTNYKTYLDQINTKDLGDQDIFDHKTVVVTTSSSGSGFAAGGGGFGGGGFSGGGMSGGGGSHF